MAGPTYFGDSDIPVLMEDFGRPVVIAGWPDLVGIPDYVGKDVLQSMGVSGASATDIVVWIQTSSLPPNLKNRTALTVDGVAMRLRDSQQIGDGAMTHLFCEKL